KMGEKIVKNVDNVVDGKLVKPVEGNTFKSVDELPESAVEKAEWAMVDDGKSLKAYKSTEGSGKWELDAEGTRAANQQLDQTALGMTPR
ncbi:hypothetical protein, partial [Streptococcus pneumoniae]|uniref:hypothetical protein n=1 Tax=Streptococcus pneumoniae TaxID=1313 RepID=UPI0018B0D473